MKNWKTCLAMIALIVPLQLFAGTLRGMIHDQDTGDVLVGATAVLEGTPRGAATNPNGIFTIANLEAKTYSLKISMLGYDPLTMDVAIGETDTVMLHLALAPSAVKMGEVNVEAERTHSGVSEKAAVRTEVIGGAELQSHSTDGKLMTALQGRTGLRTKPCALCGSMGIGLQGLDPSYTEINVDGMPVLSGLGTLYGLDGLSVADVKELQITKGSGSNLFGSGAIAGAVNLVSVRPTKARSLMVNMSGNNNGQNTISANASGFTGSLPMRFSVLHSAEPNYVDEGNDGLTDTPKYRRLNLQVSTSPKVGRGELRLGARVYNERRFAGETKWNKGDRGSADIYGREIYSDRKELSAKYQAPNTGKFRWFAEAAGVSHAHDSWYGTTQYNADQTLVISKLSSQEEWNKRHSTVFELFYNHQTYTDNLQLSTPTGLVYNTPGVTIEHTMQLDSSGRVSVQGGAKIEYWNEWGTQVIPRGTVLWKPNVTTAVRLSGGTGFRPVSIFSLEEATMAGFANVVVPKTLEPDRSTAASLGINRQWIASSHGLTLDVSTFYTHFDRKVILNYGHHVGETIYTNSPSAYTAGAEVQATLSFTSGWTIDAGGRASDVRYEDQTGVMRNAEFQNKFTGSASLRKNFAKHGLTTELSSAVYGPQDIPGGRSRSKSPTYSIWNLGMTKSWKTFSVSGSVNNLLDYTQPDDPYLRDENGRILLDSAMIYGPLLGRTYSLALTWRMGA